MDNVVINTLKKTFLNMFLAIVWVAPILLGILLPIHVANYPKSASVAFPIIALIMLLVVPVLMIVNFISMKRLQAKYDTNKNAGQVFDEINSKLDQARNDYLAAEKTVFKWKNRIIACKVALTLWLLIATFLASVGTIPDNSLHGLSSVVVIIAGALSLLPLYDLLVVFEVPYKSNRELTKENYPLLHQVVEDAKRTLNCTKPHKFYAVISSGIAVSSSPTCVNISIDVEEFVKLTRDELYQIMLHEIAHVINSDTKRSWSLERFDQGLGSKIGNVEFNLMFGYMYAKFALEKATYYQACTRFYEQNADETVKQYGNGQVYINGTAKTMLLGLYHGDFNPEINYYLFENEKVPKDYLIKDLNSYEKLQQTNLDTWNYILTHRLLSRRDTHPTLVMRMEHMGVSAYDTTMVETNEQYIAEQQRMLSWGCERFAEYNEQSYAEHRREFYLPLKAKLEKYQRDVENGTKLTFDQKIDYMQAIYHVNRDDCLALADELLQENADSSYAKYYKGIILAERLDKSCVQYLYDAAKANVNMSEYAMEVVGEFACNTGDQELLDSYRARAKDDVVDLVQRQNALTLQKDDVYTANNLSNEDYDTILDFIMQRGKDEVQAVYSVSRGEGENALHVYYIQFNQDADADKCEQIYNETFLLLDTYDEGKGREYNFNLFTTMGVNKSPMVTAFKKTRGSLIYSAEKGKLPRE